MKLWMAIVALAVAVVVVDMQIETEVETGQVGTVGNGESCYPKLPKVIM